VIAAHLLYRHPGLDPGSRSATLKSGTPDQVRGDEEEKASIAREVAQISGLFS